LSIDSGLNSDIPVALKALRINGYLKELCQDFQNRLKKSLLAIEESP